MKKYQPRHKFSASYNLSYIKKFLLFLSRQLQNPSEQIRSLLDAEPFFSFDSRSRSFSITNENLTWEQKVSLRKNLMKSLREIKPLTSIKIDEVVTGHYDQCLERYLFERINRSMPNENTCWFKFAQNNKCIGWVDKDTNFDSEAKRQFLGKLSRQKPYLKDKKLSDFLERDMDGYIFLSSNNIFEDDDKVLSLYSNIRENGFSNVVSSLIPIILGFSTKTGRYNAISGRHRIAVLRYLRSQGILSGSLKIRCHIVRYPFESLVYTRPYNEVCKKCDWGGIFDPGNDTHQNFFVREGISEIRGLSNQKGGRQKWDRVLPIFKDAVLNKKILDVGAHRGLYCLKALEYGAKHATAIELKAELAQVIDKIMVRYAFNDLDIIQGDFYNNNDYQTLVANKYDTVFLFGIIHHLLRLGIQKGILYSFDELFQRISRLANYGVIAEFAMPTESSLLLPEIERYRDAFSQKAFEAALQKFFPEFRNLGRCSYRSGNKYGRFMYYGIKHQ